MSLFQWLRNAGVGIQQPAIPIRESPDKPPVRRRYRFYGRVQGVGFRYETMGIASQLSLVGWVKNEYDGSVVIEVEGAPNYIDSFIMAIRAVPRFDITEIKMENLPLLGTETSFKLLF